MFRKLNALLWLRLQVLISNSTLLASLLMPFGTAVLYNEFSNKDGQLSLFLLSASLTMVLSMGSGYMVSIMMAEDKEKCNHSKQHYQNRENEHTESIFCCCHTT